MFPNQRYGIQRQLRDGIRGFLLDFHVGVRDGTHIRTVLHDEAERNRIAKAIGNDAIAVAERLVGRLGIGDIAGDKDIHMCHSLCELGAEPAVTQMNAFTRFLRQHPGEVLVMYVEPYVTPAQVRAVFAEAGLPRYVAELKRDEPLSTLGELVAADKRVVVLAEQDGGSLPWYLEGFSFSQDTPLGATKRSQLSCARERGDDDSPLLTVNHWVDAFPPRPRANIAFGGSFLVNRLSKCERERSQLPNVVAVDFYERSGVVKATDALNRAALRR